jgi:hypothetical protein
MDDLRRQLDALERRVEVVLRDVPSAVALACFGSRVAGGDGYADLDLLLVVDDLPAARAAWPDVLGQVAPVRFALRLDAAPEATSYSVVFAGESLYHVRPDAWRATDELLAEIFDDLRQHPPSPVLVHGDFGGANILYDPARLEIIRAFV